MSLTRPGSRIIKESGIERRSIESGLSLSSVVRQCVQTGRVDSDGYANFLTAGGGLDVDINATSDSIILALANGFDKRGAIDKIVEIDADVNISGLDANSKNYIYADRDPITGAITYGHIKNIPPIYGQSYLKAGGVGRSYSSFDGSDAATSFTDANGNAWEFFGNAQLDTAQKKFGTASLLLDGAGDYLKDSNLVLHAGENEGGFEIISWFRLNATGTTQPFMSDTVGVIFNLEIISSNILSLSLGNGSSWSIVNSASGSTTLSTGIWYRARVVWDGAVYKVYLSNNGAAETEEISVTSSVAFKMTSGIRIGSFGGNNFNGWIDDFSYSVGPQTVGIETPNANPRGGLQKDGEHWFDLNSFKMNYWDQDTTAWIEKQRVFLGEATTDGSTVTDIITYALKGQYDSDWFDITINTSYVKSHNIGLIPKNVNDFFRIDETTSIVKGDAFNGHSASALYRGCPVVDNNRLNITVRGQSTSVAIYRDEDGNVQNKSSGLKRVSASRDW